MHEHAHLTMDAHQADLQSIQHELALETEGDLGGELSFDSDDEPQASTYDFGYEMEPVQH